MRRGFKYIIVGFLLILFDIHIFIDILPDPIGYLMIIVGIGKIDFKDASTHPTSILATILLFFSIPTLFLDGQFFTKQIGISQWWGIYSNVLSLLDIILVYFLFQLIKEVVKILHSPELTLKTQQMYKWYMIIMLSVLFTQPFLINTNVQLATGLSLLLVAFALIIHIMFIFFLRTIQKQFTHGSPGQGEIVNIKV